MCVEQLCFQLSHLLSLLTFNVDATSTRIETNAMFKVCTARLTLRFLSPPRDDDFGDFEYWYFFMEVVNSTDSVALT